MASTIQHGYNGQRVAVSSVLVLNTCWCGVKVAIPDNLNRIAHEQGTALYCPVGHRFFFTAEMDELKQKLEDEKGRRRMAQQRADYERDRADENERRRAAQKAATTKARKRHAAGVCPACQRSFKQLREHMEHPDFDPAAHG